MPSTQEKINELTAYLHDEYPEFSKEINSFLSENHDFLVGDIEGDAYKGDHFDLLFGALDDQFNNYLYGYDTPVGDALAWWGDDVPPNVGRYARNL